MASHDHDAHLLLEYEAENKLHIQSMDELVAAAAALSPEAVLDKVTDIFFESYTTETRLRTAAGKHSRPESEYGQAAMTTRLAMLDLLETFLPTLERLAPVEPGMAVNVIEHNSATPLREFGENDDSLKRREEILAKLAPISVKALLAWKPGQMEENWLYSASRLLPYLPPELQAQVVEKSDSLKSKHPTAVGLKSELHRLTHSSAQPAAAHSPF